MINRPIGWIQVEPWTVAHLFDHTPGRRSVCNRVPLDDAYVLRMRYVPDGHCVHCAHILKRWIDALRGLQR